MLDSADKNLSETYWGACSRMQVACTELYEALHSIEGGAETDATVVYQHIGEFRKWLQIEADLIREAVRQYNEEGGSSI